MIVFTVPKQAIWNSEIYPRLMERLDEEAIIRHILLTALVKHSYSHDIMLERQIVEMRLGYLMSDILNYPSYEYDHSNIMFLSNVKRAVDESAHALAEWFKCCFPNPEVELIRPKILKITPVDIYLGVEECRLAS